MTQRLSRHVIVLTGAAALAAACGNSGDGRSSGNSGGDDIIGGNNGRDLDASRSSGGSNIGNSGNSNLDAGANNLDAGNTGNSGGMNTGVLADGAPPPNTPRDGGSENLGVITGELGLVPVLSIEAGNCDNPASSEAELYPDDLSAPLFERLGAVGARRFVATNAPDGLATLDLDGLNAQTPLVVAGGSQAVTSLGSTLGVAAISGGNLVFRQYDDQGASVGSAVTVAADSLAPLAVGGGGQEALVVWNDAGTLLARGIDADGALAGAAFELGSVKGVVHASVARHGAGFAVAWSSRAGASNYSTWFSVTSLTQVTSDVATVINEAPLHEVVRMVSTPTGFAVLLRGGLPEVAPYVQLLGSAGGRVGPARRLLGSFYGWDIAANGDDLGVVSALADEAPAFRPFDADMSPLAGWLCLDEPTDISYPTAVDADGAGWATVHHRPVQGGGQQILSRFGRLGD